MLNNVFSYTQVASAFVFQEDFDICHTPFSPFIFFFLRKILISFTCFFSKSFLVFLIIHFYHFYIWKKSFIEKKIFLIPFSRIFFIRIFFTRIFFIRNFFFRIWRNFYIVNIYLGIFFSITTYLHSCKKTWG